MDPNPENPDNTEPLGLEPEVNQLMDQQGERADLADDEKLAQFFGRALADGQPEAEPQAAEPEAEASEDISELLAQAEEVLSEGNESEGEEEASDPQAQQAPKGVDKRISKLTAKRKEAEERAQQLEEELESLKRQQALAKARPDNPFSVLDTEEKLSAEYERQKEIRLFCERFPDGYYEDGKEPIDKEQIAKAKVAAIRAIEDLLPKQMDYVVKRKQYNAAASKEFPWLKDKTDKRTIMAKRFVEAVPELQRFPDYEIYAAHLASGMVSYQQQKASARKGVQPEAARVPVQPSTSYTPPVARPDAVKAKSAAERYQRTSSLDDLSEVFKNKFI
jgi:hypothetical protein